MSNTYYAFSSNGEENIGRVFGAVDEKGEPVTRTKATHPYSYDGFVMWRVLPNSEITSTVYSDRLEQWDRAKTNELWEVHCPGKRYYDVSSAALQEFLRARLEQPTLKIGLLMEYCNLSTGYPCWRIDYTVPVADKETTEGETK